MPDSFSLEPYFRPRYSLEAYFRGGNILWSGSFVSISSNVFAPLLSRRQTANFEETKIRATFVVNTFIGIPLQHVVGPLQINWHILNDLFTALTRDSPEEEADRLHCKDNDDVTHLTSRKSNNTKGIKVSATPSIMSSQENSTLAKEG